MMRKTCWIISSLLLFAVISATKLNASTITPFGGQTVNFPSFEGAGWDVYTNGLSFMGNPIIQPSPNQGQTPVPDKSTGRDPNDLWDFTFRNVSSEDWVDFHFMFRGAAGCRSTGAGAGGDVGFGTVDFHRFDASGNNIGFFADSDQSDDCLTEDDYFASNPVHPGQSLEILIQPRGYGAAFQNYYFEVRPSTTTPEPSGLALFGTGILGLSAMIRRRRHNY